MKDRVGPSRLRPPPKPAGLNTASAEPTVQHRSSAGYSAWHRYSVQRSGRSLNVDLAVPASRHAMSGYASLRASRRHHQEITPPQVDP